MTILNRIHDPISKAIMLILLAFATIPQFFTDTLITYSFIANILSTIMFVLATGMMVKTLLFYFGFQGPEAIENALGFIYTYGGMELLLDCAYDRRSSVLYYTFFVMSYSMSLLISNYIIAGCSIIIPVLMYFIKWQISGILEMIEDGVDFKLLFEEEEEVN